MSRIIIVDDLNLNRYMLETMLKARGHDVVGAGNGLDALVAARNAPPDLVVSDILMPVMDGFQLCLEWRSDEKLKNIPFMFYTATYTSKKDEEFALALGADRFVIKPQEPEILIGMIDEILANRGASPVAQPSLSTDGSMRHYAATLFKKLEKKIKDLEAANARILAEMEERRRLHEELLQADRKLRQSQKEAAMGRLASGIAHDFNNILQGIMGHAEILLMALPIDNALVKDVREVLGGAERAAELIRQMLIFSRRNVQNRHPVNLHSIVHEAMRLLAITFPGNVEIRWNLEDCPTVDADPDQIQQLVVNLCSNARDAMRTVGGRLVVGLHPVDLDASAVAGLPPLQAGPHVMLTVEDNGIGMDEDAVQHVFEPYFATKEAKDSAGLALAVVQGVVQSHNAAIAVTSAPGNGTTFRVYFPVRATRVTEGGGTDAPA